MAVSNPSLRKIKLADDQINGVDLISSLPDEILHHIVSFIPTKSAIRTSVLSIRWKHIWSETSSISIDGDDLYPYEITETLGSYTNSIFTSVDLNISNIVNATTQIDLWIKLAISHNTKNLSLSLNESYRLPEFFYTNSSVKQLSLTKDSDITPKCTVSWTSLRNLSLTYCILSDESIANILSGCPMLESLTLNLCKKIQYLDLSKLLNLRRLEIKDRDFIIGLKEIVAPHIRYLSLESCLIRYNLVDVSSLTEVNLNFNYFFTSDLMNFVPQKTVLKTLAKLQNIEKLTIGSVFLQILSLAELSGDCFPQLKIKSLVVETMIVRSVIPGITRLLQNSPELTYIKVITKKCNVIEDMCLDEHLKSKRLNIYKCWYSKYGVFPTSKETYSMLDGIGKGAESKHVASFINLVKGNTKTLKKLVLRLGGYLNATEVEELRNRHWKSCYRLL